MQRPGDPSRGVYPSDLGRLRRSTGTPVVGNVGLHPAHLCYSILIFFLFVWSIIRSSCAVNALLGKSNVGFSKGGGCVM
jgi:hypothetical protein